MKTKIIVLFISIIITFKISFGQSALDENAFTGSWKISNPVTNSYPSYIPIKFYLSYDAVYKEYSIKLDSSDKIYKLNAKLKNNKLTFSLASSVFDSEDTVKGKQVSRFANFKLSIRTGNILIGEVSDDLHKDYTVTFSSLFHCSNHNPCHSGTAAEIKEITDKWGCKDWTTTSECAK